MVDICDCNGKSTKTNQRLGHVRFANFFDNGGKVACVYCGGEFSYKHECAFAHYDVGNKSNRAVCMALPNMVRIRFANCEGMSRNE